MKTENNDTPQPDLRKQAGEAAQTYAKSISSIFAIQAVSEHGFVAGFDFATSRPSLPPKAEEVINSYTFEQWFKESDFWTRGDKERCLAAWNASMQSRSQLNKECASEAIKEVVDNLSKTLQLISVEHSSYRNEIARLSIESSINSLKELIK